jgi:hypothetical protein
MTSERLTLARFSYELNNHWRRSTKTDRDKLIIAAMGMSGEAGEVLEHFKKHIRDGAPISGNRELALELGDVLHYWCRLVHETGYTVDQIMQMNVDKLEARRAARELAVAEGAMIPTDDREDA